MLPSYFGQLARIAISTSVACCLSAPLVKAQPKASEYEKFGKKHSPASKKLATTNKRVIKPKQHSSATPAVKPATESKSIKSETSGQKSLIDRIYVIPPRFGHAPVSRSTVRLVRNLLSGLPVSMYRILDQGKVNIYLTPNLMDKFPEVVGMKNDHLAVFFSEELGRTYGTEIYLCERVGEDGSTNIGPVLSDEVLKEFFYTLLSHALNDCLELPSKDRQFIALYKLDYANLDASDPRLHACVAPVEGVFDTFAALGANIMGSTSDSSEFCSRSFPRCRAWIAHRIKVLSERKQ